MKRSLAPYPLDIVVKMTDSLGEFTWAETSLDQEEGIVLVEVSRSARAEDLEDIALHEAVHVKQFVEQVISGELDDETEAYFTTYVKNTI